MAKQRKDHKGRVLQSGESQRADLTYMFRYTDKFKQRQCVYAKTLKELREKEKMIVAADFLQVPQQHMTKLTVLDLVERYRELSILRRKSTQKNYEAARNFIARYPIASKLATKLKTDEFKRWVIQLCDDGYAVSTVRNVSRMIKMAFNSAVDDGIILRSPVNIKLDFLPASNKRNALTPEELESFCSFLASKKRYSSYLDLTTVLAGTGLRVSEFAGLTIDDIDFASNTISVTKQLCGRSNRDLYVELPKSKTGERVIPMSPDVRNAMKRIVRRTKAYPEWRVVDGKSGFLNIFTRGHIRHVCAYDDIYRELCNQYNSQHDKPIKVTPHVLRHTFCTNMAQNGMSIVSLQYLMGHASSTTTLQTYTHVNRDLAHKEFQSLV